MSYYCEGFSVFTEGVLPVVFIFYLQISPVSAGFGGRGVLPGVATGSGVGPQTGVLMRFILTNLDHHVLAKHIYLKLKAVAFYLTGAGVLGQGGAGPGAGSKCHKVLK